MKKFFVVVLVLVGASYTSMIAGEKAPGATLTSNAQNRQEKLTLLLKRLFGENLVVDKSAARWKPRSEKTWSIGCKKVQGIRCRVALYRDVGVVTFLNGPERMKQFVFKKIFGSTTLVGTSSSYKEKKSKVFHKYKWGTIISYKASKQEIKVKRGKR